VSDVVGYSRLTGGDEGPDSGAACGHCAIDPTIAVHNGHVFKRTGGRRPATAGCEGGEKASVNGYRLPAFSKQAIFFYASKSSRPDQRS